MQKKISTNKVSKKKNGNMKGVMNLIAQKKKIKPDQGKSSNVIKITARL